MATHLAKVNVPLYLRNKRAAKTERRKRRDWRAAVTRRKHDEELDRRFGRKSKIVAMMASEGPTPEVLRRRSFRFAMPSVFSVVDDPAKALDALGLFAGQLRAQRLGNIYLDFTKVQTQDLGANSLLDVLVEELQTEARRTGRKIRWRGTYPKSGKDRRFMRAMGVIKRLQIAHEYLDDQEAAVVVLFNERCKHYARSEKPTQTDKKSQVTQEFAVYINKCLGRMSRELTPGARSMLCQYVGEIIDNAEEHGLMGDWSIQGYLDTTLTVPMCEIAIFNFGRTIAESFEALPATSYTRRQVQRYLDLHQKGGLFRKDWRREDLFTLIALQGGVSTKNRSELDTRGNGTVDLIDFFQRLHAECSDGSGQAPRMALLSGSTFIFFDGTYRMAPNTNGVNVIAFNNANDLADRPDARHVTALGGVKFPGTIIAVQFPLPATAVRSALPERRLT